MKIDHKYLNGEIEWLARNHGQKRSRTVEGTKIYTYEVKIGGRIALYLQEEDGKVTERRAETIIGCNRKTFYRSGVRIPGSKTYEAIKPQDEEKIYLLEEKLSQRWLEFPDWKIYREYNYEPINELMKETRIYKRKIDKSKLIRGKQLLLPFKKRTTA
ncbi:MAG: hypothetical protein AABW73_01995 [Nanoarchaeota archaeon]